MLCLTTCGTILISCYGVFLCVFFYVFAKYIHNSKVSNFKLGQESATAIPLGLFSGTSLLTIMCSTGYNKP